MLLALPKLQCYSLASVSLACYAVVYNSLKMARGRSLRTSWDTRHYGDVREPVISDRQIRVISETSMSFTLPSKSSYLDSFFRIALPISLV